MLVPPEAGNGEGGRGAVVAESTAMARVDDMVAVTAAGVVSWGRGRRRVRVISLALLSIPIHNQATPDSSTHTHTAVLTVLARLGSCVV